MGLFASLSRGYKLRRHRLGIGVHSPFAYRFVRDVIYGKGCYYSVLRFKRLTEGFPRRLKREYAVIFRLVARLAPEGVRLSGGVEPQMELLVRMADLRPIMGRGMGGYLPGKRILTICDAADLCNGLPAGILNSGNIAVVRRMQDAPQVLDSVMAEMKGGWLFIDKRIIIAVSDDREPLNQVKVKIL
ncbi:MAG: hypothetical protein NC402_01425 [Prevotella sp.]|nr:hypothetical protein [Prevotella sp.]MCM1074524.1 hypothetical protein [Ruminococcus sp.]